MARGFPWVRTRKSPYHTYEREVGRCTLVVDYYQSTTEQEFHWRAYENVQRDVLGPGRETANLGASFKFESGASGNTPWWHSYQGEQNAKAARKAAQKAATAWANSPAGRAACGR